MRQAKLLIFILAAIIASFGITFLIIDVFLGQSIVAYGVGKFSFIAVSILFLFIALAALFDGPLGLGLLAGLETTAEPAVKTTADTTIPEQAAGYQPPAEAPGQSRLDFPYEAQTEHWEIDFGDSHKTYEGSELPLWLLAGWAAFILWAVAYLISGLPDAF